MGKIKTEGRVTLEFEPDLYEISITVRAEGKTSGAAATAGKKQTEQLLQSLQDELGIKPEQLSAERETVDRPTRYDNPEQDYHFSRTVCLKIPADNKLRESITNLLAQMDDTAYSVSAFLSDERMYRQEALAAAVQCSKREAELIAVSLGEKINGFEQMFTDGSGFDEEAEPPMKMSKADALNSLAVDLQNPKIKISGEVTVVWLTE